MKKSTRGKTLLFCTAREEVILRAINLLNLESSTTILVGSSSHPISKKDKKNYLSWGEGFFDLSKGESIRNDLEKENITEIIICINKSDSSKYGDIKKFADSLCQNVKQISNDGLVQKKDIRLKIEYAVTNLLLTTLSIFTPIFKERLKQEMINNKIKNKKENLSPKTIKESNRENLPDISVVVRTYNEEKFLGDTLKSLFAQQGVSFELIIIDSQSTDSTIDIAREFDARVFQIAKKNFSYGGTLNLGARLARGSIVANLSAHAIPKDNFWLANLVAKLDKNEVAAVHGRELPIKGYAGLFEQKILFDAYGEFEIERRDDFFFSNANSAIKKELLLALPFDETLNWAEDQLWASKIQKRGYTTIYDPTAVVYHSHNLSMEENFKRAYLYYEMLFSTLLEGKESEIDLAYKKSLTFRAISFRHFLTTHKKLNLLSAFFYSAYCEFINYLGCRFASIKIYDKDKA